MGIKNINWPWCFQKIVCFNCPVLYIVIQMTWPAIILFSFEHWLFTSYEKGDTKPQLYILCMSMQPKADFALSCINQDLYSVPYTSLIGRCLFFTFSHRTYKLSNSVELEENSKSGRLFKLLVRQLDYFSDRKF